MPYVEPVTVCELTAEEIRAALRPRPPAGSRPGWQPPSAQTLAAVQQMPERMRGRRLRVGKANPPRGWPQTWHVAVVEDDPSAPYQIWGSFPSPRDAQDAINAIAYLQRT